MATTAFSSAIDKDLTLTQRSQLSTNPKVIHLTSDHSDASSRSSSPDSAHLPTFEPANFTIKEILGAIPSHCFDRSLLRSFSYVLRDLIFTAALVYAATFIDSNFASKDGKILDGTQGAIANFAAWGVYGYALGLVWTGTCSDLSVIGFPGARETNADRHFHFFL